MPHVVIEAPGAPEEALRVEARCTVGADDTADVRVQGLPGALTLTPAAAGVVVECPAVMTVASRRIAAGTPRLLRPGDRAACDTFSLRVSQQPDPEGTRALARAILAGVDPAVPAGPWVVVLEGPDAGRRFSVAGTVTVGRAADCAIRVRDEHASRRHLRLEVRRGRVLARNLRSRNGVFLNGRRMRGGRSRLCAGDELELGRTVLLVGDGAQEDRRRSADGAAAAGPVRERGDGLSPRQAAAVAFVSAMLLGAALLLVRAAG